MPGNQDRQRGPSVGDLITQRAIDKLSDEDLALLNEFDKEKESLRRKAGFEVGNVPDSVVLAQTSPKIRDAYAHCVEAFDKAEEEITGDSLKNKLERLTQEMHAESKKRKGGS